MAWVTISLRKMVLKQRISMLEARSIELSQQQQSLANSGAYAQQFLNAMKDDRYGRLDLARTNAVTQLGGSQPTDPTSDDQLAYTNALNQVNLTNTFSRMQLDSIFEGYESGTRNESDRKARALEAEQTQIEVQLKAARAEEKNLSEAMDQDIKDSAIKLV